MIFYHLVFDRLFRLPYGNLDPHLTSKRISKKIKVPLSTVQRRRTALEISILNKMYSLDLSTSGWRIVDLLIGMHNILFQVE